MTEVKINEPVVDGDPALTGRTIDYTRTYWGHNLEAKMEDGLLRGFCWHMFAVRVGDKMTWRTEYGVAVGLVLEADWVSSVDDMYRIVAKVIHREVTAR